MNVANRESRDISSRAIELVVVAALALPFYVSMHEHHFGGIRPDEFLLAAWGNRVNGGYVPYRDFFIFLGPFVPWGAALVSQLFGSGIVPVRVASVIALLAVTSGIHLLLRHHKLPFLWTLGTALWFPLLIVPLWPYASHEWFAVTFAMSAVIAATLLRGRTGAAVSGSLCMATVLTVQTIGVLVTPVCAYFSIRRGNGLSRGSALSWLALGASSLGATVLGVLAGSRALSEFLQQYVLWPLTHYKQSSGFNAGGLVVHEYLYSPLSATFALSDSLAAGLLGGMVVLALVIAAVANVRQQDTRSYGASSAVFLLAWAILIFLLGKNDYPHFAFISPIFLMIGSFYAHRSTGTLWSRMFRGVIVVGLVLSAFRWSLVWIESPPSWSRLTGADRLYKNHINELLELAPGTQADSIPIAVLSPLSAYIYTYWSPRLVPIDWIEAPRLGVNTPDHYDSMADFIRLENVQHVLLEDRQEDEFLTMENALGLLLREEFTKTDVRTIGLVMYSRTGVASSRVPSPARVAH